MWELYNLREDRSENGDLAAQHPEKLEELKRLWSAEAEKYHGLPLDDRSSVEILNTPRPQLSKPRDRYVYYPRCADVPEVVAVNIRGRSYTIVADVRLDTPDARGVLFSHGDRFGGHSLYLMDGHVHYVYNWLGRTEQKISSPEPVGTGDHTFSVVFQAGERDQQGSTHGTDRSLGQQRHVRSPLRKRRLLQGPWSRLLV